MESIIDGESTQRRLAQRQKLGLEAWQRTFLEQAHESDPKRQQMPEHSRNYSQGLKAWLARVYLQMNGLVGDIYSRLVEHYLAQQPLSRANQDSFEYGFLEVVGVYAPEYYDLAYCDWCIFASYSAADHAEFPFAQFGALQHDEQMRVCFQTARSMMALNSNLPLDVIWGFYKVGQVEQALEMLHNGQGKEKSFRIARQEFQPAITAMTTLDSEFLRALQQKICLADLPEYLHFLIPEWIQAGYIVHFSID